MMLCHAAVIIPLFSMRLNGVGVGVGVGVLCRIQASSWRSMLSCVRTLRRQPRISKRAWMAIYVAAQVWTPDGGYIGHDYWGMVSSKGRFEPAGGLVTCGRSDDPY